MPTGYTATIKELISFKPFILSCAKVNCARTFDALVDMRNKLFDAPVPQKKKAKTSFTIKLKHKKLGEILIENITEIHYCYQSFLGKRIAFESDIEGTGYTYAVSDVIEFEAV